MPSIGSTFSYIDGIPEGYKNEEHNSESFYPRDDSCPFCKGQPRTVFSNGIIVYDPENKDTAQDVHHSVRAKSCDCGWWTVKDIQTRDAHDRYAQADWVFCYRGALRKFSKTESGSQQESIRSSMLDRFQLDEFVEPQQLEAFVEGILSDIWPGSRVYHCGIADDKRTNLLLFLGDKPFALQINNRREIAKDDRIKYISNILGLRLVENEAVGVYVTLPLNESSGQNANGVTMVNGELVRYFHLTDKSPFFEMLDITGTKLAEPWRKCIPAELFENTNRLTPYSITLRPPR